MAQSDKKFLSGVEEYIAGFIHRRHKETGQYVTRDEIASALLADPQIQALLQTQYQNSKHDLPWHAGNLVDWFSANLQREVSAHVGDFERMRMNNKWAYRPAPAAKDLTIQELVRILQDSRRTASGKIITKAFLQKVADQLVQEVGTLAADVGTQAGPANSAIQFIDRAYFFLDAAQRQHSLFPRLAVFVLPGRIWWGLYSWGSKEDAQAALETLQALDLLGEHEVQHQIENGPAQTGWTSGMDIYAGRVLSTGEVNTYSDVDSLVSDIVSDLADWQRRVQPQLPALYARLQPYLVKEMSNRTNDQADQELFEAVFDPEKRAVLLTGDEPLVLLDEGEDDVATAELEMLLPPPTPYMDTDFLKKTYMEPQQMQALVAMLQDKRQLILYGPPGTGKTYVAQELGRLLTGLAEPPPTRLGIVQFHPAYGYEDFMEGIRPESIPAGNGHFTVNYPVRPGIFRHFCEQAQKLNGPCILIIDEINRGNMARIFGELMFLLEYRDKTVTLPYSGVSFQVPDNVYLIGTMNTADRSIALVDFALRRRFHFFRLGADPDLLKRWLEEHPAVHSAVPYLAPLYRQLAGAIEDKDYAIGHSHFMKPDLDEQKLERIWHYSIMPYLEEYYLDQPAQAGRWQWNGENVRPLRESYG